MLTSSLKPLALAALLATPAAATTFEFVAEDDQLVPELWNYREVATRTVIGCRQWDFLQGSGWFQATWYSDLIPAADGNLYTVKPQSKLAARICAARMDQYNSVRVAVGTARGSFSVNPDGLTPETTITCRPHTEGSAYDNLQCDEAHVAVPLQGTVRIHMRYEE